MEKYLKKFEEEYNNNALERDGSNNTGCIIMDVNSGEILAMASYPSFDLNNPKNSEDLVGRPMVDERGLWIGEYLTAENYEELSDDLKSEQFNALWRNSVSIIPMRRVQLLSHLLWRLLWIQEALPEMKPICAMENCM